MKKAVYIFLLIAMPLSLNAYTFTRTLRLGDEGEDVLQLQKFLNTNTETQLSTTGTGSPGKETYFFGLKTQQSIIKLQNIFSEMILKPVGLNIGNGFVGLKTIEFLNSHQVADDTNSNTTKNDINKNTVETTAIITSVTPEEIKDGDTITIIGSNFSPKNNSVIFGFESKTAYKDLESTENGTKIQFKYISSIQTVYDEKYSNLSKKVKAKVLEQFPQIPVAVSVIASENSTQSNFKTINFILK